MDVKTGCDDDNLLLVLVSLPAREGADPSASSAPGRAAELWQKESSGISMVLEGNFLPLR